MSEFGGELNQSRESSSNLYLREISSGLLRGEGFDDIVVNVLEKSQRPVRVEGQENIPNDKPFIVAMNHFVRVDDREEMTGKMKMNDMLSSMGAVVKLVREKNPEAKVVWTPSEVPRPEAIPPSFQEDKSASKLLHWLVKDSKFAASNFTRKVFLDLVGRSPDILSVPYSTEGMRSFLREVKARVGGGDILALFPEGEVSQELRQAKDGVAHIAISTQTSVLPISQHDEDGTLVVRVGNVLSPPERLKDKTDFTNKVMASVAEGLPKDLRGAYAS